MPELAARLESLSNDGDDRQVPARHAIQVAEEAGIPFPPHPWSLSHTGRGEVLGEIVDQLAAGRIDALEEAQQLARRIAGKPVGQIVNQVVRTKHLSATRQPGQVAF